MLTIAFGDGNSTRRTVGNLFPSSLFAAQMFQVKPAQTNVAYDYA